MDHSNRIPSTTATRLRTPRKSYSCTECTRRKLRCSKNIPCSACVDRGISHLCRRRRISAERSTTLPDHRNINNDRNLQRERLRDTSGEPPGDGGANSPSIHPQSTPVSRTESDAQPLCDSSRPSRPKIIDNVAEDAAVTLEFLALGRQRVLQVAHLTQPQTLGPSPGTVDAVDLMFTGAQLRTMIAFHEESISWTHNVVHLPTFRQQCEDLCAGHGVLDQSWLALYYALIAMTLFHTDPTTLEQWGIQSADHLAEICYQKAIDTMNAADFMSNHSLFYVQAICLLIYIGHNLGQSDRISVLLACGVRIAQCLCLHRLGPDESFNAYAGSDPRSVEDRLIDREVSKRAWWFLVRQDWLQIPFNNTYTIHPTQFNTPMPKNCHEISTLMIQGGSVIDQDQEVYTQGSYTAVLNQVSVLIWKTQDRMCSQGHPQKVEDGLRKLYTEVLDADRELKQILERLPCFYKSDTHRPGLPPHIKHQNANICLTVAHKFYSIHRHFQIPSFKDPWFAYTKLSCVPMMRRGLLAILSLPDDSYTWITCNLWTVNTQIVTAAVWLLFELIFSREDQSCPFDAAELRELALRSSRFLQVCQHKSRIATRGIALIDALLDMDQAIERGEREQFVVENIITMVETRRDQCLAGSFAQHGNNNASVVDWLSRDAATWENLLDFIETGT